VLRRSCIHVCICKSSVMHAFVSHLIWRRRTASCRGLGCAQRMQMEGYVQCCASPIPPLSRRPATKRVDQAFRFFMQLANQTQIHLGNLTKIKPADVPKSNLSEACFRVGGNTVDGINYRAPPRLLHGFSRTFAVFLDLHGCSSIFEAFREPMGPLHFPKSRVPASIWFGVCYFKGRMNGKGAQSQKSYQL
jgi:hypothetical protein